MSRFPYEGPVHSTIARTALAVVAAANATVAVPAIVSPRWFYDDFPLGAGWVSMLPPFNEHLIGDVGGLYLAFTVLFAWAAITLRRALVVPLCLAWAAPAVIHFVYHAARLDGWDAGNAIAQTISLALVLVLPVLAIASAPRTTER